MMVISKEKYVGHIKGDCFTMGGIKTILPEYEKSEIKFRNTRFQHQVPFWITADLECFVTNEPHGSEHIPNSFAFYMHANLDVLPPGLTEQFVLYRGDNPIDEFWKRILEVGDIIAVFIKNTNKPMIITGGQQAAHDNATICYLCMEGFTPDNIKVHDHCHITGKYRGPACNRCNLNYYSKNFKVPVIFHNAKNYDTNLLLKHWSNPGFMTCIAENKEKMKYIDCGMIRIIDSLAFMKDS